MSERESVRHDTGYDRDPREIDAARNQANHERRAAAVGLTPEATASQVTRAEAEAAKGPRVAGQAEAARARTEGPYLKTRTQVRDEKLEAEAEAANKDAAEAYRQLGVGTPPEEDQPEPPESENGAGD